MDPSGSICAFLNVPFVLVDMFICESRLGFYGHVTMFRSMFLCTCADKYIHIYVVEVWVMYVMLGGCLSMYLNTYLCMNMSLPMFLYLCSQEYTEMYGLSISYAHVQSTL